MSTRKERGLNELVVHQPTLMLEGVQREAKALGSIVADAITLLLMQSLNCKV